jgi:hypothetical protein
MSLNIDNIQKIDTTSFYLTRNGYQIICLLKLLNDYENDEEDENNRARYYYKAKHPYGMIVFVEHEYDEKDDNSNIPLLTYRNLEKNEISISDNLKKGVFKDCNKNSLVIIKDQLLSLVLTDNKTLDPIIENYTFLNENDDLLEMEGYFIFPIISIKEIKKDPKSVENYVLMITACLRKYIINRIEKHYFAFLQSNQTIQNQCQKYENIKNDISMMLAEKIRSAYEEASILKSKNQNIDGVITQDFKNLGNLNDLCLVYLDEISKMERLAKDMRKIERELEHSAQKLSEIRKSQG